VTAGTDYDIRYSLLLEVRRVTHQRDRLLAAIAAHRAACVADDADDTAQHDADVALWETAAAFGDRDGGNGGRS
jgi:hypothetical protein